MPSISHIPSSRVPGSGRSALAISGVSCRMIRSAADRVVVNNTAIARVVTLVPSATVTSRICIGSDSDQGLR